MQAAEALDGGLDGGCRGGLVGGVADLHEHAILGKTGGRLVEFVAIDIEHDDTRAFIQKTAGSRQADAGCGTGDEDGFIVETVH